MDKFIIEGGRPLKGAVKVNGAKNAALPLMAAALLAEGRTVLKNVPNLMDIGTMGKILTELGVRVQRRNHDLVLEVVDEEPYVAPYELVRQMRASICVLGPLLAKRQRAKVSLPGGCVIGVRPIDLHIKGMVQLGATTKIEHGYVEVTAPRLRGASIYLGGAFGSTVTGTQNVMMAAVLAEGTTVIESAACEPEVQEVAHFLNKMGAGISGIGTHRLTIEGVKKLKGVEHTVIPDRIEAATFMVAAAITHGEVTVEQIQPEHVTAVIDALRCISVGVELQRSSCRITSNGRPKAHDIATLPYPGFPTDMQAQFMTLLSLADGISIITEKIYPDRFMHVAELGRMGAEIRKEGHSAIIHGVKELHGAPTMASDLRASAALVIAGLAAKGTTEISRIYHIDRGYEKIEKRLVALGAKIKRAVDKKFIIEEPPQNV